jgi:hypothetical protein
MTWKQAIPSEDQSWISKALFKCSVHGTPELKDDLQLWYNPPIPPQTLSQPPKPEIFFHNRLLVWMPYKLWQYKFICKNDNCINKALRAHGLYRRPRRVLDVDTFYTVVTDVLICGNCRSTYVSWSPAILDQLDIGHRIRFPIIMTQK